MNWIKKFTQWLLSEELGRRQYDHKCFVKEITTHEGERGAIVHITDYNMNIFIPLRKENVSYEVYGVHQGIKQRNERI